MADLIEFCGGFVTKPCVLVNGGPMMGQPLPSQDVPVVKGMSGILALTKEEINEQPASACIRCGACVTICPCGLAPVEMAPFIRKDDFKAAARLGVMDCFSCGSCSWVCPSHIPLVHYFNYAKGMIAAQERERRKNDQTRALVEAHILRAERAAEAKGAPWPPRKPRLPPPKKRTKPPHDPPIHQPERAIHPPGAVSVQKTMFTVLLALLPATAFNLYLFGWPAILLFSVTVGSCVVAEAACLALAGRPVKAALSDYSAVLTGWLLAMSLPPWAPWWIGVLGAVFAIGLAKHTFGGIGQNLFNPAMVARVALLVSFPVVMTAWVMPASPVLGRCAHSCRRHSASPSAHRFPMR